MDASPVPQLKEEIMELDFGLDGDPRKKRRNRTTQSCLNCHTSKRKCDRKRPCSRCIQLGLTGLCIYETSDPNERDDPDMPEVKRLRNRVAELESLVRELRGKPHPAWAERIGKPMTNGHRHSPPDYDSLQEDRISPVISSGARTTFDDTTRPPLYRLSSDSPNQGGTYRAFQANGHPEYFDENDRRAGRGATNGGAHGYSPVSPSVSSGYGSQYSDPPYSPRPDSATSFSYPPPNHNILSVHDGQYHDPDRGGRHGQLCPCLSNPSARHTFIALSQTLQSSTNVLRQLQEHSQSHCPVFKQVSDLSSTLNGGATEKMCSSYESHAPTNLPSGLTAPAAGDYHVSSQAWQHMTNGYSSRYTVTGHVEDGYGKSLAYHVGA